MLSLALMACTQRHSAVYLCVDAEAWELGRELTFEAPVDSQAWTTLHVRSSAAYPYTTLALELRYDTLCDTLVLPIAAPLGTRLQHSSAPLPRPINGPIRVRHIMATELLSGITNIGIE